MMIQRLKIVGLVCFFMLSGLANANSFGEFIGTVVAEWSIDGRSMTLTKPFAYVSPTGIRWDAPAGSIIDGASIPQVAWSIIGGPFEGKYRNASVIHDVACVSKNRPWQAVHEAFYTAMLAADVDKLKAKIMYAAVYHFGPRWPSKFELINIPLTEVDSKIKSVSAEADTNDKREVKTRYRILPGRSGTWGDVQLPVADVTITFVPPPNQLSQEDFDALKEKIEVEDTPLDAIRSYRPAHQAE